MSKCSHLNFVKTTPLWGHFVSCPELNQSCLGRAQCEKCSQWLTTPRVLKLSEQKVGTELHAIKFHVLSQQNGIQKYR